MNQNAIGVKQLNYKTNNFELNDITFHVPKGYVTGFIGSSGKGAKPFPLTPAEVDKILGSMGMSRLDAENDLKEGEKVKVISGPFEGMYGVIKSVNLKDAKLEVSIDLFGQETIVELELSQISKA